MFIHILMSFCMEYMCIVAVKPLNTILGGDMKANIHGTSILTCLLPRLKYSVVKKDILLLASTFDLMIIFRTHQMAYAILNF